MSAGFERSLDLKGIEVYRFTLQPNTLAAPTENPDNRCFCKDPVVTKNCSVAGALDVSSCQGGQFAIFYPESSGSEGVPEFSPCCFLILLSSLAFLSRLFFLAISTGNPIYISLPHFLHGSHILRENVLGLNPSEEHHITYLDVEPVREYVSVIYDFQGQQL